MHWPIAFKPDVSQHNKPEDFYPVSELPPSKTFEAMLELRDKGLVKSVGVSNFTVSKLEKLIAETGMVPSINQAKKENVTPAQLLIAWAPARDTITIPKSTNAERIAENLEAATHIISDEAEAALDSVDVRDHYVSPESWFYSGVTYEGDGFWA